MGRTSAAPAAPNQAALPLADPLIAAARERLAGELASLPSWGSPAFWARVRHDADTEADPLARGTLAALVAEATRREDATAARALFTALLEEIEAGSQRWAARIAAQTAGARGLTDGGALRDDLCQELALRLWRRLAVSPSEGWWLFFERALEFERRHTATAYMTRNGFWPRVQVGQTMPPARLDALLQREAWPEPPDARAELAHTAAELADLAAAVAQLPERERIAVVLRFWRHAPEAEIAQTLGCAERTVRNLLRRAYARLRAAYTKEEATS
jgi:RNA polymerase sigma factor (sigma-70 family)